MPSRHFGKDATKFLLVRRAQNDPLIHDSESSDMVFTEKVNLNDKARHLSDLDSEFGGSIRGNEGEAANHGIYFDDSEYDYMQHLRETDASGGEAVFVPAAWSGTGKGKQMKSLAEQLQELDLQRNDTLSMASSRVSKAESLLPKDMLPSEFVATRTYQDQQDVPDAIAGFQPDMDPRLREVLEALDNEAYVDDDENMFKELSGEGEVSLDDFEATLDEEDDGWESDDTIKGVSRSAVQPDGPLELDLSEPDAFNPDWMKDFKQFKKTAKTGAIPVDHQTVKTGASSLAGLRRKKRKGALTASTGYSMTSSVLARTEALSILDERFDKIQDFYNDDGLDDGASIMSGLSSISKISTTSKPPSTLREDFDQIIDGFLGDYSKVGRRRVRREKPQTGLEQLDEIRKDLGPARISAKLYQR
jgi:protein LTV1